MKVNIFAMPTVPATAEEREALRPIGRNTERYQMMIQELRDLAVLADGMGYDGFSTTEHHFHTEGGEALPNPLLLYVDLATRTKSIKFIPMSLVLPAQDPIRLAEDLALFDQMFPGRSGACLARGYQKRWIQVLAQQQGVTSLIDEESDKRNREIYDEYLEIMLKAWSQDSFDHDGKHYQVPFPYEEGITGWGGVEWTRKFGADGEIDENDVIRKIGVVPKPFTEPHPPIFIPVALSPRSLVNAAERGFIALVAEADAEKFHAMAKMFQEGSEKAGRSLSLGQDFGAVRSICLGETTEEARQVAMDTAVYEYHCYFTKLGMGELFRKDSDPPHKMVEFDDLEDGLERMMKTGVLLCGTPDEVKYQMEDLVTCHSPDKQGHLDWLVWTFFAQGTQPFESQQRQLEMFAEKVWPAFR